MKIILPFLHSEDTWGCDDAEITDARISAYENAVIDEIRLAYPNIDIEIMRGGDAGEVATFDPEPEYDETIRSDEVAAHATQIKNDVWSRQEF